MNENAKRIWGILRNAGISETGAAAMIGNMQAESALKASNAQDGMTKLTDEEYTGNVNLGAYANFATDGVGYGLCQWSHPSRKNFLLAYAKSIGTSVGDLAMQVNFCIKEMQQDFSGLWTYLKSTDDLFTAVSRICKEYERPAVNNINERLRYAQNWYKAFKGEQIAAESRNDIYWPPRTIDLGMSGADVGLWQAVMRAKGYECEITEEFDERTRLATIEFQTEAGITPDGIPGPISWAAALKY